MTVQSQVFSYLAFHLYVCLFVCVTDRQTSLVILCNEVEPCLYNSTGNIIFTQYTKMSPKFRPHFLTDFDVSSLRKSKSDFRHATRPSSREANWNLAQCVCINIKMLIVDNLTLEKWVPTKETSATSVGVSFCWVHENTQTKQQVRCQLSRENEWAIIGSNKLKILSVSGVHATSRETRVLRGHILPRRYWKILNRILLFLSRLKFFYKVKNISIRLLESPDILLNCLHNLLTRYRAL